MDRTVSVTFVRKNWGKVMRAVENGSRYFVTLRGRPVGVLVGKNDEFVRRSKILTETLTKRSQRRRKKA